MPSQTEEEKKATKETKPPDDMMQLDLNKIIASFNRQLGDLHTQVAMKDAIIETQQEDAAKFDEKERQYRSMIDDLSRQVTALQPKLQHNGRTTKGRKAK